MKFCQKTFFQSLSVNVVIFGTFLKISEYCVKNILPKCCNMLAILTGQLQNEKAIEHSENKVITYFETRLDLECSIPAFNNHAPCKKRKQPIQNQVTFSSTIFLGYSYLNKGECNLNQSKDGSFVERVAKNNS